MRQNQRRLTLVCLARTVSSSRRGRRSPFCRAVSIIGNHQNQESMLHAATRRMLAENRAPETRFIRQIPTIARLTWRPTRPRNLKKTGSNRSGFFLLYFFSSIHPDTRQCRFRRHRSENARVQSRVDVNATSGKAYTSLLRRDDE